MGIQLLSKQCAFTLTCPAWTRLELDVKRIYTPRLSTYSITHYYCYSYEHTTKMTTTAIQRSQSTPHFGDKGVLLFHKQQQRPQAPRRTKTTTDFLAMASASQPARQAPREDPFNMGGFFPSHHREEDEWSWLHAEDEEEAEDGAGYEEQEQVEGGEVDEVEAGPGAVIRSEDKLGILSLRAFSSVILRFDVTLTGSTGAVDAFKREAGADDRLYSPYSEEACDEESLRLALCARRVAHEDRWASSGKGGLGELFLGGERVEGGRLSEGLQLLAGLF